MYDKVKGQGHFQGQTSQKSNFCHFGGYMLPFYGYKTSISHVIISYYLKTIIIYIQNHLHVCQGQRSRSFSGSNVTKIPFCLNSGHFWGNKIQCCGYETSISHVIMSYYLKKIIMYIQNYSYVCQSQRSRSLSESNVTYIPFLSLFQPFCGL